MENVSDANSAEAEPSASSALETALNGPSNKETPTGTPQTSAETLNTGTEKGQEEQVPWHKDPRFQAWQSEKKELSARAERAQIWDRALQENPEFAKEVLSVIERLSKGKVQEVAQPTEYDPIAEKLMNTKVFGSLKNQLEQIQQALQLGAQELSGQRFEATKSRYVSDFGQYMKDFQVHPEYQQDFEQRVWSELAKLSPESIKNHSYDAVAFKQAVDTAKERYTKLTNGITSSFTQKASTQQVPKTGKGGLTPLSNVRSIEDEQADFVSQLKALAG